MDAHATKTKRGDVSKIENLARKMLWFAKSMSRWSAQITHLGQRVHLEQKFCRNVSVLRLVPTSNFRFPEKDSRQAALVIKIKEGCATKMAIPDLNLVWFANRKVRQMPEITMADLIFILRLHCSTSKEFYLIYSVYQG